MANFQRRNDWTTMPCGTAHPIDGIDLWRYSRLHRWEPGNWSGSRFTSMYSRKAAPYRRSELASRRRRMGCKTFVLHARFPGPGRHPSLINESKGVPPSSVLPRRTSSMALCGVTLRFLNRSPAPERGSGAFRAPTVRSKPPASPRTPPALHRSAGPAPGQRGTAQQSAERDRCRDQDGEPGQGQQYMQAGGKNE